MKKVSLSLVALVIILISSSEVKAALVTGLGWFSSAQSNFPSIIYKGKGYPVSLKLIPKESAYPYPFDYVCKLEQKTIFGWSTVSTVKVTVGLRVGSPTFAQPVTISSGFSVPSYHLGSVTLRWNINGKPIANVFVNLTQDKYVTSAVEIKCQ